MKDHKYELEFDNTLDVRTLNDYATGAGYDALKYVRATPAIEKVTPVTGGRDFGYCKVWAATSARDLIQQMSADIDLRAYYMGAEAGVTAKLIDTFEMSENAFTIIARQTIEARNLTITGESGAIQLSEDAKERLAAGDLDGFHRKYGGYYCHTVVLGGELYVAYQCTMTTKARATEVSASISGSYPDVGELMVKVGAVMKETASESRWQMTAQTLGAGGTLDDFDPNDPASVRKAVMKFMKDFDKNVHDNPQPYYGQYDGYWRFFEEAAPLKDKVVAASVIVDELADWAAGYADHIATINAFLDPDNGEGYRPDAANRTALEKLKTEVGAVWKKLKDAYNVMELFGDFKRPTDVDVVKDHAPSSYDKVIEDWRTQLKSQLIMGQTVYINFPDSGYHVGDPSFSLPDGETPPQEDLSEPLGSKWPYIRLSLTKSAPYQIKPVGKDAGTVLKHGDVVKLVQSENKDFDGWMVYMSVKGSIWTLGLAPHEGGRTKQYQWRVNISGCKDKKRIVTTNDTVWLSNLEDETCFMSVGWTDYLCVTRKNSDEWKIKLGNTPS